MEKELTFILKFKNEATAALASLKQSLASLGQSASTVQKLFGEASKKFDEISKSAFKMAESLDAAGKKIQSLGRELSIKVTAPILGAAAASVKFGADFSNSIASISTLGGAAESELGRFREGILAISNATGENAVQLADAMKLIRGAGIEGEQGLQVLFDAAKAAQVGLGDLNEIARFTVGATQAFASEGLTSAKALDVLTAASQSAAFDQGELLTVMRQVGPAAAAVGVSFEDTAAALAGFSRLGINAGRAGGALQGLLSGLLKDGPAANTALATIGSSVTKLRNDITSRGLAPALVDMIDKFERLGPAGQQALEQAIPGIRSLSAVLAVAGKNSTEFLKITESVRNSGGRLNAAFARSELEAADAIKDFGNSVRNLGIVFSETLLPIFIPLLRRFTDFVTELQKMDPALRHTVVLIAAIAASIGPALIALGALARVSSLLPAGLGVLAKGLSLVTKAAAEFSFASLLNPLALATAAIAALVAALFYYRDTVVTIGGDTATVLDFVVASFQVLYEGVSAVVNDLVKAFALVYNSIVSTFDGISIDVTEPLKALLEVVRFTGNNIIRIFQTVGTAVGLVFSVMTTLFENGLKNVVTLGTAIKKAFSGDIQGAIDEAKNLVLFEGIPEQFTAAIEEAKTIFGEASDPIGEIAGEIGAKAGERYKARLAESLKKGGTTTDSSGLPKPTGTNTLKDTAPTEADGESFMAQFNRGFQKGMGDFIDAAKDGAKIGADFFTSTWEAANTSLTNFLKTGKFNFKEFAISVLDSINQIAIKLAASKIFELLGMQGTAAGGGTTGGGLLGSLGGLFQGTTSSAGPTQPGALNSAGGIGSLLSQAGPLLSSFFAEGGMSTDPLRMGLMPAGAFRGAQKFAMGGTSDRIPAMLSPGEAVIPLSRGRKIPVDIGGGGRAPTVIVNISTPDAGSFARSQTQVQAAIGQAIKRAQSRNT